MGCALRYSTTCVAVSELSTLCFAGRSEADQRICGGSHSPTPLDICPCRDLLFRIVFGLLNLYPGEGGDTKAVWSSQLERRKVLVVWGL